MAGNYFNNRMVGEVVPMARPRYTSQPIFSEHKLIGITENADFKNYSQVKVWAHKPTLDFPEPALMISLQNAKASCFAKLNGIEEMQELIVWLQSCVTRIKPVYEVAQSMSSQIKEQLKNAIMNVEDIDEAANYRNIAQGAISPEMTEMFNNFMKMVQMGNQINKPNEISEENVIQPATTTSQNKPKKKGGE